ncbi:ABC transporter ATP-binding protein [Spirosoma panaciterrae]|uniref:ATP-binding cassette domain-containing protein n=1 Tax=Spirosoma panaciterrae TaxID=496058 RepID=UPI000366B78B|nr:ABC transporter ATP-binding protein [Spirosoma panaciterrae]
MKLTIRFWRQHTHLQPGQSVALLATGIAQAVVLHLLINQHQESYKGIFIRGISLIVLPFAAAFIASRMAAYTTSQLQLKVLDTFSGTRTNDLEQVHTNVFGKAVIIDMEHLFQFWRELFVNVGFNIPVLLYLLWALLTKNRVAEISGLVGIAVCLFGFAYTVNRWVKRYQRIHSDAFLNLLDRLQNYVDNVLQFRLYHSESKYIDSLRSNLTSFSRLTAQLSQYRQMYATAVASVLLATIWGGLWFLQTKADLSTADLAVATLILLETKRITAEVLAILYTFQKASESAERIRYWSDMPPSTAPAPPKAMPFTATHIQNLTFSYQDQAHTIQYPDLAIQPGDKVWLQGHNGRGKSTLWKILTGLYTNSETTVWLDKAPRQSDGRTPFWRHVAAVTEPPRCYSGSLWEIIGNFSANREEVVCWLSDHRLLDFFHTYPNQLDTYYDSVTRNLSAGQLKWLLLVQALFQAPDLLILDEPFSSLDASRQQVALFLLEQLPAQMTLIVISHHKIPIDFTKTIPL